jgi:hypothetical protein
VPTVARHGTVFCTSRIQSELWHRGPFQYYHPAYIKLLNMVSSVRVFQPILYFATAMCTARLLCSLFDRSNNIWWSTSYEAHPPVNTPPPPGLHNYFPGLVPKNPLHPSFRTQKQFPATESNQTLTTEPLS